MDTYLTKAQVVRLSKITRKTIDAWVKSGKLSTVYVNNRQMIQVAELLRVCPGIRAEDIEKELVPSIQNDVPKTVEKVIPAASDALQTEIRLLKKELEFRTKQIEYLEKRNEELLVEVRRYAEERATLQAQNSQTLQILERVLTQKQLPARKTPDTRPRDENGRFLPKQKSDS